MANENEKTTIEQPKAIEKVPANVALTANGLAPQTLDEAWRYAICLSKTAFVPEAYRNKPEDCLIAIDMAMRLRVAPLMFLQNSYNVRGKPGLEAKLVIALVNNSGLFTDPLEFETLGDDPKDKKYRVRAVATRVKTGKVVYGPWVTWDMVEGEGWDKKDGSKWKTIPGLMFIYRAASWFANANCPEVKMGMATTEELMDIASEEHRQVESVVIPGMSDAFVPQSFGDITQTPTPASAPKERSKFGFKPKNEQSPATEPAPTPAQTQAPAEPQPNGTQEGMPNAGAGEGSDQPAPQSPARRGRPRKTTATTQPPAAPPVPVVALVPGPELHACPCGWKGPQPPAGKLKHPDGTIEVVYRCPECGDLTAPMPQTIPGDEVVCVVCDKPIAGKTNIVEIEGTNRPVCDTCVALMAEQEPESEPGDEEPVAEEPFAEDPPKQETASTPAPTPTPEPAKPVTAGKETVKCSRCSRSFVYAYTKCPVCLGVCKPL